jgi:hypothetical protein
MQFAGVLPEDAPDPQLELDTKVRSLPFSVVGLGARPTLEDHGAVGVNEALDAVGPSKISASISYTLWRNPSDRDDPVNLAELD